MSTKAFGIDLGTTNAVIAHLDYSDRPAVVPNSRDEQITPSTVYFQGPKDVLVGTEARNASVLAPRNYVHLVKPHMGSPNVRFPVHGHDYTPAEISALVLRYLADQARQATGVQVEDVVITVPAHFGVAERKATRVAGEIAGLTVRDVIVEPVAAALHYGHGRADQEGVRHVLVCDLGGGTCDTTVIRIERDHVQVLCFQGDGDLGGRHWDERVRDHLADEFVRQHPRTDPLADEHFRLEVTRQAEQAKQDLSRLEQRAVALRFKADTVTVPLTRTLVEELTSDLVDRVVELTRQTVREAGRLGVSGFDDVLLVGGMTRWPAIASALRSRLGLAPRLHDPHLAVAKGAAIFAAQRQVHVSQEVRAGLGVPSATVVPRSIGIKALDPSDPMFEIDPMRARMAVQHLLVAGETLPTKSDPVPFGIVLARTRMAAIEVWEQKSGEDSMDLDANAYVGRGFLRDMPPKPKGSHILIWFAMSETGELSVHACDPDSNTRVQFDLQLEGLSDPDVARSRGWIAQHSVTG